MIHAQIPRKSSKLEDDFSNKKVEPKNKFIEIIDEYYENLRASVFRISYAANDFFGEFDGIGNLEVAVEKLEYFLNPDEAITREKNEKTEAGILSSTMTLYGFLDWQQEELAHMENLLSRIDFIMQPDSKRDRLTHLYEALDLVTFYADNMGEMLQQKFAEYTRSVLPTPQLGRGI